jgi:hypothetical protein
VMETAWVSQPRLRLVIEALEERVEPEMKRELMRLTMSPVELVLKEPLVKFMST